MAKLALWMACLVIMAGSARAGDFAGGWDMRVQGVTIWRFVIARDDAGDWTGVWVRPTHFWTDGFVFKQIEGPPVNRSAETVREEGGTLILSFAGDDDALPTTFRFDQTSTDQLTVEFTTASFPAFLLYRAQEAGQLGPWDPERIYRRALWYPTSAEMTALFEADQAARSAGTEIDWAKFSAEDQSRRMRTQELLEAGKLQSGDDFYHAAFIFQHGDEPSDYLKAHVLATIAISRGKKGASWIAAATLDRYLQSIGRKQIFGTQYSLPRGEAATQEPFDRALLSDAVRAAAGVPKLEAQEVRRRELSQRNR